MSLTLRSKTVLVLILTGLSVYVGLVNVADRLSWRQPSDGLYWTQTPEGIEVRGWEPDFEGLVGIGDRLVDINGISIRNLDEYVEVLEILTSEERGVRADYTFRRAASGEELTVPIRIELESQVGQGDILLGMVAFIYLGIGLLVFLRHTRARGAFHFYLICLFAFMLFLLRYSGRADGFDLLIYWCSAVALLVVPPLFLHLCLYFPVPLPRFHDRLRWKLAIYAPAAVLLGLYLLWFAGWLKGFGFPRTPGVGHFLDRLQLIHFVAYLALAAGVLAEARRRVATPTQRKQMKWMVDGTLVGVLPFGLLYGIPYLLGQRPNFLMELSVLSLALIPLSFGYAISRYRLMDVEVIFKNSVAYVLTSSALLGVYVGLVLLISLAVHDFSPEASFPLLALSALVVAFLFAPLKNKIQEQIDRHFYREQYDYRHSLAEFGKTLGSEMSLARVGEKIVDRIDKTLGITPVALFLRSDTHGAAFRLFHSRGISPPQQEPPSLTVEEEIFAQFQNDPTPVYLTPVNEQIGRLRDAMRELGLYYLHPLNVRDRVVGFLGLGRHRNGDFLSSEDRDLLSLLAGYAGIALDNALLYRSLELKAAELAELKVYNESVVESITLGVAVVTPEGEITVWNGGMRTLSGVSSQEAVGKHLEEVLPRDLISAMRRVVDGPRWEVSQPCFLYKTHLARREGESRLVNITLSPFVSQENIQTGILVVFDDITEKVRLENQLLQAEKLSSIGLFAAGLAHEVNTPLAGISSYTQMLLEETSPEDPRFQTLKKIEKQSFRASEIINNLLNFARFSGSDFQELNLNSLMVDTLSLLDHQFKRGQVDVELELDPGLPKTVGNGSKLQQVFMNLFLNAKDAMPEGGKLRVRSFQEHSELVVQIHDTGVGISAENIKKIYDPFFTTKEVGKGTGLGLSVSYGIIQEHSGRIHVDSSPGKGTTFTLYLPIKRVN